MKETKHICAFALPMSRELAMAAIHNVVKDNFIDRSELHWRLHPAQVCQVANLFVTVATSVCEVKSLEEIEAVKRLSKECFPSIFLGLRIDQTSEISESHAELIDSKGFVLARITDLAIPLPFFEAAHK